MLVAPLPGQPAYGVYRPGDLVALLKYRVLPTIDFLFEHDVFPVLYRMRSANGMADKPSDQAGDATGHTAYHRCCRRAEQPQRRR
ncbi:MAG: hypothetical protein MI924_03385 [Chloroflexales bacterium]|nr:hypothetical protein [Chloroflexales bacterium]